MSAIELPGYEFLEIVGEGSMGAVYKARHLASGDLVAIKTLQVDDPSLRRALANEFEVLCRVEHPLLINEREILEHGNCAFLVMEFIESVTLGAWIKEHGQPERVAKAGAIAEQLGEVLTYLHSQDPPVIVRDLKPENVLLRPDGTIKLIDFGVARALEKNSRTEVMLKGYATMAYAPLEQYSEQATTSPASDVYSLGATLYHLLKGEPPSSAIDMLSRGASAEEELKQAGIDPRWSALVGAAMKLKAPQRISLEEFTSRIPGRHGSHVLGAAEPVPAAPTAVRIVHLPPESGSRDWLGWLAVVFLVAVALLLMFVR